jgi:hypothetical protein
LTVTYKVEKKCPIESKNEPAETIDAGKPGYRRRGRRAGAVAQMLSITEHT